MRDIEKDLAAMPKRDIEADLAAMDTVQDERKMPQWDLYGMSATSDDRFPAASTNVRVSPYGQKKQDMGFAATPGLIRGLSGGLLSPAHEELKGETSYKIGELIGLTLPFGVATKALRAVPWMAKLPGVARPLVRGGLTGAALGTTMETGDVIRGGEFDVGNVAIDAATFAALDGVLSVAGRTVGKLIANRGGKRFAEEVRRAVRDGRIEPINNKEVVRIAQMVEDGSAARLVENGPLRNGIAKIESMGDNAKRVAAYDRNAGVVNVPGGPQVALESPNVTWDEVGTMMKAAEKKPPTTTNWERAKESLETGIRMHEGLGTKKLMYWPVRAAENAAAKEAKAVTSEFESLIKGKIPFGSRADASERVMLYATAQQRGGMRVLGDMGIKELPQLSPQEAELYAYMRGKLEVAYNETNAARVAGGIKPFPKQQNYFTWMRTLQGELDRGIDLANVNDAAFTRRFARAKQTPFRFEKGRIIDNYGELKLDAFGVFRDYMVAASRHKNLTPIVAKCRKLLDQRFYNDFTLADHNPAVYKSLNDWVNHVAGVRGRQLPKFIERGLRSLNQNIAFSVLSYNVRSASIQPTALRNTVTEIGVKHTLRGLNNLIDPSKRAFALKHSNHLVGREFDVAVEDAMRGVFGKLSGVKKTAGRMGMRPLQWLDQQTATASWLGSYDYGRSQLKMSMKNAINYADDVVVRTQASAMPGDIAPIQRSTLGKTLTMFQTFVINDWGYLTKDLFNRGGVNISNRKAFSKVLTYITTTLATNIIFEDILGTRSPHAAPEHAFFRKYQETGSLGSASYDALLEGIEAVPGGGAARYGSSPLGATVQFGTDAIEALRGESTTEKTLETVGKGLGVPGTVQVKKTIRLLRGDSKKK